MATIPAAETDEASTIRRIYLSVIGLASIVVFLQAVWAGLFVHEGQDYKESWVRVHARGADVAIVLAIIGTAIVLLKMRDRRDLLFGSVAFVVLLVLEAYIGGMIGDRARLTVIHFPLGMALMALAVWLPFRAATRRGG